MGMDGASRASVSTVRARLSSLGAATVGESGGQSLPPGIGPVWPGAAVCGPAFTAWCPQGDNLALHAAATRIPAGHVLVAATGGAAQFGYFGEILATAVMQRGGVGLITDGGARDVAAIERLGFGVFAAGLALRGTAKSGPGVTGCPVLLGNVRITPGDWVVADTDGVTVVATGQILDVLTAGEARAAKEQDMLSALRDGKTTADLLALDFRTVPAYSASVDAAAQDSGGPPRPVGSGNTAA